MKLLEYVLFAVVGIIVIALGSKYINNLYKKWSKGVEPIVNILATEYDERNQKVGSTQFEVTKQPLHTMMSDILNNLNEQENIHYHWNYGLFDDSDNHIKHEIELNEKLKENPDQKFNFEYKVRKGVQPTEYSAVILTSNEDKVDTFQDHVKDVKQYEADQKIIPNKTHTNIKIQKIYGNSYYYQATKK